MCCNLSWIKAAYWKLQLQVSRIMHTVYAALTLSVRVFQATSSLFKRTSPLVVTSTFGAATVRLASSLPCFHCSNITYISHHLPHPSLTVSYCRPDSFARGVLVVPHTHRPSTSNLRHHFMPSHHSFLHYIIIFVIITFPCTF